MLMRQSLADPQQQQQQQPQGPQQPQIRDPFLSQPSAQQPDLHNRQESADSGVGGMGSNFNLGSIPEVDMDTMDMDTTLTEEDTGGLILPQELMQDVLNMNRSNSNGGASQQSGDNNGVGVTWL